MPPSALPSRNAMAIATRAHTPPGLASACGRGTVDPSGGRAPDTDRCRLQLRHRLRPLRTVHVEARVDCRQEGWAVKPDRCCNGCRGRPVVLNGMLYGISRTHHRSGS
jgi:hypothetical protein